MNNKPVAWFLKYKDETYVECPSSVVGAIPLYTNPANLTDEKIIEVRQTTRTNDTSNWADTLAFARAILRKAQEK